MWWWSTWLGLGLGLGVWVRVWVRLRLRLRLRVRVVGRVVVVDLVPLQLKVEGCDVEVDEQACLGLESPTTLRRGTAPPPSPLAEREPCRRVGRPLVSLARGWGPDGGGYGFKIESLRTLAQQRSGEVTRHRRADGRVRPPD